MKCDQSNKIQTQDSLGVHIVLKIAPNYKVSVIKLIIAKNFDENAFLVALFCMFGRFTASKRT